MTSQPTNSKRWRPKFSIRTLIIAMTLLCCYAACWGPTKQRGVEDVATRYYQDWNIGIDFDSVDVPDNAIPNLFRQWNSASAPVPFIVSNVDYPELMQSTRRVYHFWFFGYVAKLPYERELN